MAAACGGKAWLGDMAVGGRVVESWKSSTVGVSSSRYDIIDRVSGEMVNDPHLNVRIAIKTKIQARVEEKLMIRELQDTDDEKFAREPLHCQILHTACDILSNCLHAKTIDAKHVRMQMEMAHRLLSKELEREPCQIRMKKQCTSIRSHKTPIHRRFKGMEERLSMSKYD